MPDLSDRGVTKADMRSAVFARRRSLPAATLAAAAGSVVVALDHLVRRRAPHRICAYVPVGTEPGGPSLPEALAAALPPGGELLLPVLRDDLDLDWARYSGALVAAERGLREPPGPRLGVAAVAGADLVVVPAVAVDRQGLRLGRGGGSYDRALARVSSEVPTVALLHDGELVDRVPADAHDRRVSAVITPADGLVWI